MGSVEKKLKPCPTCAAPCEYEVKMRGGDYGWSTTDEQRTFYKFNAAALREQPEARGVVDAEKLARLISEWELHDRTFGHDGRHPLIADFRAILTAAQQPGQEGGGEVCPRCKGAGEYEGFARHASGDPQDEYAATVQCEPCEGTGEVAAPQSAPVGDRREIDRVIRELRAYNPAADEYRGEHIHGVWAKELERALTQQPAQAAPGDGVSLIAAERRRQVQVEGWAPEHDDEHTDGAMAAAAACYASFAALSDVRRSSQGTIERMLEDWPWEAEWWKPSDRIRDLTKAGALIAAEIDRLQRATPPGDDAAGGGHD